MPRISLWFSRFPIWFSGWHLKFSSISSYFWALPQIYYWSFFQWAHQGLSFAFEWWPSVHLTTVWWLDILRLYFFVFSIRLPCAYYLVSLHFVLHDRFGYWLLISTASVRTSLSLILLFSIPSIHTPSLALKSSDLSLESCSVTLIYHWHIYPIISYVFLSALLLLSALLHARTVLDLSGCQTCIK